jgi:hypothetical protein
VNTLLDAGRAMLNDDTDATQDPNRGRREVELSALSNAPVVNAPQTLREVDAGTARNAATATAAQPEAGALAATPQRCACMADNSGTTVVAHGGSLDHEITLCTASSEQDAALAYVGAGVIPPEVFNAFPTITCRGRVGTYELTVQRYATGTTNATVPLFSCRRAAEAPDAAVVQQLAAQGVDASAANANADASALGMGTLDAGEAVRDSGVNANARVLPNGLRPGAVRNGLAARPVNRPAVRNVRRPPAHRARVGHRRGHRRRRHR